jgi:glycosyltransferase involved in cell wall biosynthesis
MKVLIEAISAKRGGIATYTNNLIDALKRKNVDVVAALPSSSAGGGSDTSLHLSADNYGPLRRVAWSQLAWRRVVREIAPDVLFSSANFGLLGSPVPQVLLLREGGLFDPFYLTNVAPEQGAMSAVLRYFRRNLMLASAKNSDHVMVPSDAMKDLLLYWRPELAEKCTVNPYGTLSSLFHPAPAQRPWCADGTLRLIYVSVYYPHKNPAVLCSALERLRSEGRSAHATITMNLDEIAIPGGALDRFVLERATATGDVTLGHRDYEDLPTLYGSHDVFVFPSVSETFGHPMAEAMASGLPIVAADTPINREVCGDAALYFSPFSVSQLVDRIRMLDGDPDLRDRLRQATRDRVRHLYEWDMHVTRLLHTFETVIEAARR